MDVEIPKNLNTLIGQICCNARVGYAGSLVLDFGEKIYSNVKRIHNFMGEWSLRTDSCTWRMDDNQTVICGFYDEEEENDKFLKKIISLKLLGIEHISHVDIELKFENDYRIFLIGQSKDTDFFGILAPNNTFIGFNPTTKWYTKNSNIPMEGLSEKERILDLHSEVCFKRWQQIVPKSKGEEKCKYCAYYRPLRGEFYFWDYGICSNANSQHDGKMVGCESGCTKYDISLSIDN